MHKVVRGLVAAGAIMIIYAATHVAGTTHTNGISWGSAPLGTQHSAMGMT